MSQPIGLDSGLKQSVVIDPDTPVWLRPVAAGLLLLNRLMLGVGMLAIAAAALVLTSSVVSRYMLHASTDWQDETAVFLLVGATFLCTAYVQSLRGHVGIEALVTILPAGVNRARRVLVDAISLLFCVFFTWKSAALLHEAWMDGQTTTSTWGPPLTIPYGLMAVGMVLLCLQIAVQLVARCNALLRGVGRGGGIGDEAVR